MKKIIVLLLICVSLGFSQTLESYAGKSAAQLSAMVDHQTIPNTAYWNAYAYLQIKLLIDRVLQMYAVDSTTAYVTWDKLTDIAKDSIAAQATAGVGDITSVTASIGLSGGGTTGAVTLKVDTTFIATLYQLRKSISDSLAPYMTAFKLDTVKIDTAMWRTYIQNHKGGSDFTQAWKDSITRAHHAVDIRSYGAVEGGVADCYAAFNTIAGLVNTSNETLHVVIPPGRWRISTKIWFKKGPLVISGLGDVSVLVPDDNIKLLFGFCPDTQDSAFHAVNTIGSVEFRDFRIDGKYRKNWSSGSYPDDCGYFKVNAADKVVFDNITFDPLRAFKAIDIGNCNNVTIKNSTFKDMQNPVGSENCIDITDTQSPHPHFVGFQKGFNYIANNYFYRTINLGIDLTGQSTRYSTVIGNKFKYHKGWCIAAEVANSVASRKDSLGGFIAITANQIDSCNLGIMTQEAGDGGPWAGSISITDNIINRADCAIYLVGSHFIVKGNHIENVGYSTEEYAIRIFNIYTGSLGYKADHGSIISDNFISGASGKKVYGGIYIEKGKDFDIHDNIIADLDTSSVEYTGASGIFIRDGKDFSIHHNLIKNTWGGGILLRAYLGPDTTNRGRFQNFSIDHNELLSTAKKVGGLGWGGSAIVLGECWKFKVSDNIIVGADSLNDVGISQYCYSAISGRFQCKDGEFSGNKVYRCSTPYQIDAITDNQASVTFFNNLWNSGTSPKIYQATYNGVVVGDIDTTGLNQARWQAYIRTHQTTGGADADAVVGNEVTNTTNATLTRSGSGTSGAPYTLSINLNNANTWTARQNFSKKLTADTMAVGSSFVLPAIDGNANQALVTNGAGVVSWQNIYSGSGVYYLDDTASGVLTYKSMLATPDVATAEEIDTVQVTAASGERLLDAYITEAGVPGFNILPSGIWTMHNFRKVDNATGDSRIKCYVYKRTGSADTLLFSITGNEINDTGVTLSEASSVQGDFFVTTSTRLVFKYYGYTTSVTNRVISLYHNGMTNYSHISTPITSTSGTEIDGIVGNEVTNATNSTLTRSGSGTGVSPYTLGLNLGNANTWTALQTLSGAAVINGSGSTSATSGMIIKNSAGTELMRVQDGGNVGIGTSAPATILQISETGTTATRGIDLRNYSASAAGANLNMRHARGTEASHTVITTADTIGGIHFWGADAAGTWVKSAGIDAISSGTIASTRVPSVLTFSTSTDAAPSVLTERVRIGANSATSPAIALVGDVDTGIYQPSANSVAVTGGGTQLVWWTGSVARHSVVIETTSSSMGIRPTSAAGAGITFPTVATTQLNSSGINLTVGVSGVGIGTATPLQVLDVTGNVQAANTATLGNEVLTNGALTGGTSWTVTGGFSVTTPGNVAKYLDEATHVGTLDQAAVALATPLQPNRLYKFVYTVTLKGGTAPTCTIPTSVAASAQALMVGTNGTYTLYFYSAASVSAFQIAVTLSVASGTFTLDDLSLKEVQGGDVIAMGKFTGGGTAGIKVLSTGDIRIQSDTLNTYDLMVGNATASWMNAGDTHWTAISTRDAKENILPINFDRNKIKSLVPVSYTFKEANFRNKFAPNKVSGYYDLDKQADQIKAIADTIQNISKRDSLRIMETNLRVQSVLHKANLKKGFDFADSLDAARNSKIKRYGLIAENWNGMVNNDSTIKSVNYNQVNAILTAAAIEGIAKDDSVTKNWDLKYNRMNVSQLQIGKKSITDAHLKIEAPDSIYSKYYAGDALPITSSSKKKKKDIEDLVIDIEKFKAVKAKTYKFVGNDKPRTGLLAEDFAAFSGNSNEIDYNAVLMTLWSIVQQQEARIETLEKKK